MKSTVEDFRPVPNRMACSRDLRGNRKIGVLERNLIYLACRMQGDEVMRNETE